MVLTIVGAVLAIVGVAVAVYAFRVAIRQTERAAMAEAQAQAVAEEAEARALALATTHDQLSEALAERDEIHNQFSSFLAMLQDAGIIRRAAEPLTVSADDLTYELQALTSGVPAVEGIDPATMQAALEHLAARAFSDDPGATHPMSRPYMVGSGPLSRGQFERLRDVLIDADYLTAGEGPTASATLTERGRALLEAIHTGRLVIR